MLDFNVVLPLSCCCSSLCAACLYYPPPRLQENDSLKDLLSNPVIAEAKKKEVVKRLAAEASFSQVSSSHC